MNIKITYNWLLEHLDTDADPYEIQKYLSLCGPSIERVEKVDDDYVLDVEVTSNRIDMASVIGIARECQAILPQFGKKAILKKNPHGLDFSAQFSAESAQLEILDPDKLVNRVVAVVIDKVEVKPAPQHMQKRLQMCDIASINNLIDITNYIMLEIGHPTHIFDYDRIATHQLLFRYARKGEKIVTLHGDTYEVHEQDIVIDDGTGTIIDLPGIIGTKNSVVTATTKKVIFFSENSLPAKIRKTSMTLGIRTLAAAYNEKGPDPELTKTAIEAGLVLYQNFAGGTLAGSLHDISHTKAHNKSITVKITDIQGLMGIDIPPEEIEDILKRLEFKVHGKDELVIDVPSFRNSDMNIKEDIIEEVARIYGYHKLPSRIQQTEVVHQPQEIDLQLKTEIKIKYLLKHLGYHESYNYSMISLQDVKNCALALDDHVRISNPISQDIEYIRISLVPSLLKNAKDNQGKIGEFMFFELANVYKKREKNLPEELQKLVIIDDRDYFSLKGIVERIFSEFYITPEFTTDKPASDISDGVLLSKNCAYITINIHGKNEVVGWLGALSPHIQANFQLKREVYVAQLDIEKCASAVRQIPQYKPVNPFAVVKLDITIFPKKHQTYAEIVKTLRANSSILSDIEYVGQYKNNITLRCFFSYSDRNMTEDEAKHELSKLEKLL